MDKRTVFLLLSLVGLVVIFETGQQLYYLRKFKLAEDATFFFLFQRQAYRWLVWAVLGIPLFYLMRKIRRGNPPLHFLILKALGLILALVVVAICCISLITFFAVQNTMDLSVFAYDYLAFFLFQKAPLFTLGYIGLAGVFYFYQENNQLQVEVKQLGELKQENTDLYQQLKENHQAEESVLTIKSGSKYEVVSLQEIVYIEADDYHAIIHHGAQQKKLMRISLKTLETQLPDHFLRVHRKYIVNRHQVECFSTDTPHLQLRSGDRIPVAKSRQKEVRALFVGERVR